MTQKQTTNSIADALATATASRQPERSANKSNAQRVIEAGVSGKGSVKRKASAGKAPAFTAEAKAAALAINGSIKAREQGDATARETILRIATESHAYGGKVDADSNLTAGQELFLRDFQAELETQRNAKAKDDNVIRVYKGHFKLAFECANYGSVSFAVKGEDKPKLRDILDTLKTHARCQTLPKMIEAARVARRQRTGVVVGIVDQRLLRGAAQCIRWPRAAAS